jgi:hypothetical protein
MRTYVERTLVAPVSPVAAWDHLARVTDWPSWAPHIRRIEIDPPGALGPASRGAIHLRAAPTTTFRMVSFDPPHAWAWEGPLLTLTIHYDHRFEALPDGTTRISFVVSAGVPGSSILGPIFAKAYTRSLDRANPQPRPPARVASLRLHGEANERLTRNSRKDDRPRGRTVDKLTSNGRHGRGSK